MILLLREKEVALDSALKFVDPPSAWFKRPVQHRLRSRASTCPVPGDRGAREDQQKDLHQLRRTDGCPRTERSRPTWEQAVSGDVEAEQGFQMDHRTSGDRDVEKEEVRRVAGSHQSPGCWLKITSS